MPSNTPTGFLKKSEAVKVIPRSSRQLTRDISDAVASRDQEALDCFELRIRDGTLFRGDQVASIELVKKLKADGKAPKWFVDAARWTEVLHTRSKGKSKIDTGRQNDIKDEPQASGEATGTEVNKLYLQLLEEKDERIVELKSSKDFLERILEQLVGKDTLTALAEIVADDKASPAKISDLIRSNSNTSTARVVNPQNETSSDFEDGENSKNDNLKTQAKQIESKALHVVEIEPLPIKVKKSVKKSGTGQMRSKRVPTKKKKPTTRNRGNSIKTSCPSRVKSSAKKNKKLKAQQEKSWWKRLLR